MKFVIAFDPLDFLFIGAIAGVLMVSLLGRLQ